ncbi:hypothetical protein A1O3_01168 [Capronia epimyces CBS 606.96]|uniref:Uncharacterized protein n=1 Tax=Capronia epimyces CBS 606.96 TaxID=1182542 RepID=W9YTN1_9EURO|nr:uncharacterized protein A1O3_01168 [Capronia epimyces CBS 606.96]EXJ92616.1 hypothetical protein A1O3_01168 [Capronia epimyces CBS 606.96]
MLAALRMNIHLLCPSPQILCNTLDILKHLLCSSPCPQSDPTLNILKPLIVSQTASLVTGYTNGVYPSSGANDATAALSTDLIRLGTLSLTPYGSIIASPSTSFDLTSFSFGCGQFQANPQAPGVPVGCAISVTGFDISDQQIPEATFSYAPPDLLGSHMVLATLPSTFRGLKNVTLGVAASSLLVPTTLLDIDDVKHCNYS